MTKEITRYFITLNGKRYYSPEFLTREEASNFLDESIENINKSLKWAINTKYENTYRKELDKYSRMKVTKYEIRKIETYD